MIKMSRYAVRAFFMLGLVIFVQIFSVRSTRLLSLSNTFDQNSHCVEFPVCAEIASPGLTRVNTVLSLQSLEYPEIKPVDTQILGTISGILKQNRIEYLVQQRLAQAYSDVVNRGAVGRLYSADLGLDVALFPSMSQSVVDAPDSAAYFSVSGATVIGDHQNQGFSRIRNAIPGSTTFTISDGTNVTTYRCIASYNGINTGYDLVDEAGSPVYSKYPGSVILYTCKQDWRHVTIVHFIPIS